MDENLRSMYCENFSPKTLALFAICDIFAEWFLYETTYIAKK